MKRSYLNIVAYLGVRKRSSELPHFSVSNRPLLVISGHLSRAITHVRFGPESGVCVSDNLCHQAAALRADQHCLIGSSTSHKAP
jgi:hypothetical protein